MNYLQTSHIEKMTKIIWNHPTKGEITEILCDKHADQVFKAIVLLGIGCDGQEDVLGICLRCVYDGYDFREWIDNE